MKFTHVEKIYWKSGKVLKKDLLFYYEKAAKKILFYLKNRPLVMHRFPDGVDHDGFFQKEAPENLPPFVKTALVKHKERKIRYILVDNIKTLLYVANLGSIELHPFSAKKTKLSCPDYLAFDLDPEKIPFQKVIETALALHELLDELKVPNYCKTTGGRGLHIFVPLKGKYSYEEAKQFARKIAKVIHEKSPSFTSLERNPKKRGRKVYIDCLQNSLSQTLIAPFSARAADSPTVSTPLEWSELKKGLDPKKFTIFTVLPRLRKKESFQKILGKGANLKMALKRLEKVLLRGSKAHIL